MPTRATIAIKNGDEIRGIYCHFDGYYKGVGKKLLEHYNTVDKVEALIALGDISSLGDVPEASWFVKRFGFADYMLSKDNPLNGILDNDKWLVEAKVFGVPDEVIQEIKDLQAEFPDKTYDYIAKHVYCEKYTIAYVRDSELRDTELYLTLSQLIRHSESFCYLFDVEEGIWKTEHRKGNFTPLTKEMCE